MKDCIYKSNITCQQLVKDEKIVECIHIYVYTIAKRNLCIPVSLLTEEEITEWINIFMRVGEYNISIGDIGTSDWYDEFYNSKENK